MNRVFRYITASLMAFLALQGCSPQSQQRVDMAASRLSADARPSQQINQPYKTPTTQTPTSAITPSGTTSAPVVGQAHVSPMAAATVHAPGVSLLIDSGAVNSDVNIRIITTSEEYSGEIPSHMENLTEGGAVYRMLPDGQRFDRDITIAMRYDSTAIPYGYTANDIYTFYYNEQTAMWQKIERDSVDTRNQIVYSRTNHFTDYINGVLKAPESSDAMAYTPTSIKDLKAADPTEGVTVMAPPEANSMGTATMNYPITLPAGRRGMQPTLNVSYNSEGGNGILGQGWSLPVSEISVDTRRGVPLYSDIFETETYTIDGEVLVTAYLDGNGLLHLNKPAYATLWKPRVSGTLQLYPRVEGQFRNIVRHGTNPSNYYFEVTDKNGVKYIYGENNNGRLRDNSGHIARWCLQRVEDAYGNQITYDYNTRTYNVPGGSITAKQILPQHIQYTNYRPTGESGHYHVDFIYANSDKLDASTSARFGFLEADAALLDHIDVRFDNEVIKHYFFGFKEGAFGKTLLCNIIEADPTTAQSGTSGCTGDTNEGVDNFHEPNFAFTGDSGFFAYLEALREIREKDTHDYYYPDTDYYNDYYIVDSDFYSDHRIHGRVVNSIVFERDVYDRCTPMDSTCMHMAYREHTFHYSDVPLQMLSNTHYVSNQGNGRDNLRGPLFLFRGSPGPIEGSGTRSWNIGGAIDVGFGFNTFLKSLTLGGSYTFNKSNTEGLITLVDLNGDGFSDKIYKRGDNIYYRLRDYDDETLFLDEIQISGIDDFLHNTSKSNTWGIEGSVGASGVGVAFGLNWTDGEAATTTYFSDMNGDGLPDLVSNGRVYYNQIFDDNNTVFVPAEAGVEYVLLSSCAGYDTVYIGEPVDDWVFADFVDSTIWFYDSIYDEKGQLIGVDSVPYTYTVPRPYEPDLENVRFWQAPHQCYVHITDSAHLLPATIAAGDGVRLIVQLGNSIVKIDTLLPGVDTTFLDNVYHMQQGDRIYFRVQSMGSRTSDRLMWNPTVQIVDQYDNYTPNYNSVGLDDNLYSYESDYLLSGLQRIMMPFDASLHIDVSAFDSRGSNPHATTRLQVLQNGVEVLGLPINGSYSSDYADINVNKYDIVQVRVIANGLIDWSAIEANCHMYIVDNLATGADADYVCVDTLSDPDNPRYFFDYYPQIQKLVYTNAQDTNTVYMFPGYSAASYSQFGTMYRHWGQFAYKAPSGSGDLLDESLLNTMDLNAISSFNSSDYEGLDTTSSIDFDSEDQESNVSIGGLPAYNPLAGNFFMMQPDFKHMCWSAYSDYAYIERGMLSNVPHPADGLTTADVDTTDYESSMAIYTPGAVAVSKKTFNKSFGVGGSINASVAGIGWSGNLSVTKSESHQLSDMLDLNGDGLPDVLSEMRVQYTQPFGGLSQLRGNLYVDPTFSEYSIDTVDGGSFAGSAIRTLWQPANNTRRSHKAVMGNVGANLGGSKGHGGSQTTWVDLNGDGLVDKVYSANNNLYYYLNTGYGFLPRTWFSSGNARHTSSFGFSGGASLGGSLEHTWLNQEGAALDDFANSLPDSLASLAQLIRDMLGQQKYNNTLNVSITAGFGASHSENKNDVITVDLNGDGLPDRLIKHDDIYHVEFNNGNSFNRSNAVLHVSREYDNISWSTDLTGAITVGVTIGCIPLKIEGNPKGGLARSVSRTEAMWTDMNGDGIADYVWDAGDGYIAVRYSNLGVANRLIGVDLPTGGHYAMTYALNNDGSESNRRHYVLTSLTISDRRMASPDTKRRFEYYDRHYDRLQRDDYGYSAVITTDEETLASNANYRTTTRYYHNKDYMFKGLCYQTLVADGTSGTILGREDNDFRLMEIVSGDLIPSGGPGCYGDGYPALFKHYKYVYDGGQLRITGLLQFGYTAYGNIDTVYDYGATNDPGDDYIAITHYATLPGYIVSKVDEETVWGGSTLYRRRWASYTNQGDMSHLSHVETLSGEESEFDYTYDIYGNVVKMSAPSNDHGQRHIIYYDYDHVVRMLPERVSNIHGLTSNAVYDYRWQKPRRTVTVNGGITDYHYDRYGRLAALYAPMQQGTSTPTIKYRYYDHYPQSNAYWRHNKMWARTLNLNQGSDYIGTVTICDGLGRQRIVKKDACVNGADLRVVSGWSTFDGLGRTVREYHPITENLSTGDSVANYLFLNVPYTSYTYDRLDRRLQTTYPDGTHTSNAYGVGNDADGVMRIRIAATDQNSHVTTVYVNLRELQTSVVDAINGTTVLHYDHVGQLVETIDPEHNSTTHTYDGLGRRIERNHPSSGLTLWKYDPAGNLISIVQNNGEQIDYRYDYNRVETIKYSTRPWNNVHFRYGSTGNSAGRIEMQQDATGVQCFSYDAMGNVINNVHTYIQPASHRTITLVTKWKYDVWGRVRDIVYPDEEAVSYRYDFGGNLCSIRGSKPGQPITEYIQKLHYDEYGQRVYQLDGNEVETRYIYNPLNRRLDRLVSVSSQSGQTLQDNSYFYDAVGNVTSINGSGIDPRSMHYTYDAVNRLVEASGNGNFLGNNVFYDANYSYSLAGRLENKKLSSVRLNNLTGLYNVDYDNYYDYPSGGNVYAVDNVSDVLNGTVHTFHWDGNGNLDRVDNVSSNSTRLMCWTEDNRLQGYSSTSDEGMISAWYNYNAGGDRNYKLTSPMLNMRQNAVGYRSVSLLVDPTLYASALITLNRNGYTKHYFEGNNRICSKIGGGFGNVSPTVTDSQVAPLTEGYVEQSDRQRESVDFTFSNCLGSTAELAGVIDLYDVIMHEHHRNDREPAFYYQTDHLGSATYLTNDAGQVTQTLGYLPYGEDWVDVQHYSETQFPTLGIYGFNGKEKDYESGFHYYGARYYWSDLLTGWLSVDPMQDKYPSLTPYNFCTWNPVNLVDPNGEEAFDDGWIVDHATKTVTRVSDDGGNTTQSTCDPYGNYPHTYNNTSVDDFVAKFKKEGYTIRESWQTYAGIGLSSGSMVMTCLNSRMVMPAIEDMKLLQLESDINLLGLDFSRELRRMKNFKFTFSGIGTAFGIAGIAIPTYQLLNDNNIEDAVFHFMDITMGSIALIPGIQQPFAAGLALGWSLFGRQAIKAQAESFQAIQEMGWNPGHIMFAPFK